MTSSRQRMTWWSGWLGLLLVVAGCGPAKTEVSGTVRYKGKPLTAGQVVVVDADRMPHTGLISAEGSYTASGIPVGPVQFAVLPSNKPEKPPEKPPKRKPGERPWRVKKPKDRESSLPSRYTSPATSGLSTTLKPEPNTFDLDLE